MAGLDQRQLTDNDVHDVTPNVRGGYTVWQTQFADGWKVGVFDTSTKSIDYIDAVDGFGVAENPRFVLVFDQIDGNGDIKTLGYDFDSKSTIHLGSLPQEMPEELPEPEQTGETRALIQAKPSNRDFKERASNNDTNLKSSSTPVTTATTTLTGAATSTDLVIEPLVIESATTTEEIDIEGDDEIESIVPTSTPTITPTTTSNNITSIPDVVIPPFTGSSTQSAG